MTKRAGLTLLAAGLVAFALVPAPAMAQQGTSAIRYSVGYFTPTSDYTTALETGGELQAIFESTFGVGIGYEYMFSDTIGVDVSARYFNPEIRVIEPGVDAKKRMRFFPVTLGPMFHFGTGNYHFYAGPELAYISWGQLSAPENTKLKSELTGAVKFGVDIPLGQSWSFNSSFEYIFSKATVDVEGGPDLKPNPVLVMLGATYHF